MTRRDGLAILFLAAACLAFFGPAVFGDRAVFTWNMDVWHPWRATSSAEEVARPTRAADCPRQFYVMRHLATLALRDGHIPLWNRWIYAGTPFLANFQPGVFYPPNLLLAISGLDVADQMTAYMAFHFFLAASGAYLLLRRFAVAPLAALLGAIVFTWSGFNVARTGIATMPATGSWLPWVLVASHRWFDRGGAAAFAGMALTLAMAGLAGFFQIFVFTGYAWLLFGALFGVRRRPALPVRRWVGWLAAGALALCLVCVHLVPTVEFVRISQEAKNSKAELIAGTLHPWVTGKMVVPDLLGNPADHNNATHRLRVGNGFYFQTEHSTALYVGLLPFLLGGILLLNPGDRRREALFAIGVAGGGLLFCFPSPILEIGRHLPGLDFSRPDRATFLYCAGMGLIAGLGAERLLSREGPGWARTSNLCAIAIGLVALAFALTIAVAGERVIPARVAEIVGAPLLHRAGWIACVFASLSLALVAGRASGLLAGSVFAAAALVLGAADVGWTAWRMNFLQPKSSIFRPPQEGGSIAFLQERRDELGPFRIMSYEPDRDPFTGAFPPSNPAVYGIEDVLGFDSLNTVLYQEAIDAVDPEIILNRGNFQGTQDPTTLASPILDLLGARYIVTFPAVKIPGMALAHRSDLAIYENPEALPRAFFVDEVRVLGEDRAVVRAMADPSFSPSRLAYSTTPIDGLTKGAASADSLSTPRVLGLTIPRDEVVRVEVETPRSALLVLTDSWYPGWFASVDGSPRTIHRVDHAFRGVVVEPGTHEVVFTYRPASFRLGAALSLVGLAGLVAGSFAFRRKDS